MLNEDLKKVALRVSEIYGCNVADIERLIELTGGIKGVSFVSIKGYNSDKSQNTEVADQLVNVGVNYNNMLFDAAIKYTDVDVNKIDVDGADYRGIDTNGLSLEDFKQAVRDALPQALINLTTVKENVKPRENNDVYFNKALVFNTNTLRLSIMGTTISKTVVEKGEYKLVKSKPITVAQNLIKKHCEPKVDKIRRFTLDNMKGVNLKGDTLEIGGGKQDEFTTENTGAKFIPVDQKQASN